MRTRRLDIAHYVENASKNLSYRRLFIYTCISIVFTVLMILTIIKNKYEGKALIFSSVVLILIAAYGVLNILALFRKNSNSK